MGGLPFCDVSHFVAGCGNNLQNVFDTVINYIYHTVLQEKKHLPWAATQRLLAKSLQLSLTDLTLCCMSVFPDEVIIMSQHETIYFKKSDTEGNLRLCTLSIWNLNHFDMGFHHVLIFSLFSFFFLLLPRPKPCRRTRRACSAAQIASEWAWEGSTPIKSCTTSQKRQPDYFLNAMFLWISHSGDSLCDDCW